MIIINFYDYNVATGRFAVKSAFELGKRRVLIEIVLILVLKGFYARCLLFHLFMFTHIGRSVRVSLTKLTRVWYWERNFLPITKSIQALGKIGKGDSMDHSRPCLIF